MLRWYSRLSALRNAHAALRSGAVAVYAPAEDAVCVLRSIALGRDAFGNKAKDEALLTVVNRAARTVTCSVELAAPGAGLEESERLALLRMGYTRLVPVDGGEPTALENGRAKLKLPPCSAVIYELKK